ncbi:hypothetical protein H6P81_016046 [Aristolochia fimbriata]|uniref:Uncharacterized protein n=1 Tax=Aristolochia fimbriata TaxID=158543 RepID=A0AAV7EA93_ARIFI|nr:hypothetical protein H6P81_016046 [Aristolochia fimbriata]
MCGPALRPYSPEPKTLISHKVRRVLKATSARSLVWAWFMVETRAAWACFEHSNFFKVTAPEEAATRPVKARAHRPVEGASRPVHTTEADDRPTKAAAGTGLALNGSSLRDLGVLIPITRLSSRYCYLLSLPPVCQGLGNFLRLLPSLDVVAVSQAPSRESNPNSPSPVNTMDQPGSILSRPGASTAAPILSRASTPGPGGIDGRAKLRRSDFVRESTKSIGTAAFTWVHEHFRRPAFEHTRRECQRPNKARGVRAVKGKAATTSGGSSDGKHHSAHVPACTTRRRSQRSAIRRCPTRAWRANKGAIGAPLSKESRSGGGTEQVP